MTGDVDVAVVGAGAAGLFASLRARGTLVGDGSRLEPPREAPSVRLFDGSERIGRKILVSGGGRCNVTNISVDEQDFVSDAPRALRSILREFPVESTRHYFASRGLPLVEEPIGKLFPQTQRARDVISLLVDDVERSGVVLETGHLVTGVALTPDAPRRFRVEFAEQPDVGCDTLIIATGGKSIPRTGSTGFGYELAQRLGQPMTPPRPALTPIFLEGSRDERELAGLTCAAILTVSEGDVTAEQRSGSRYRPRAQAGGSLLFTHKGLSGPCALDISEACAEAGQSGVALQLHADFWTLTRPESDFPDLRSTRHVPGCSLGPRECPRPVNRETFARDLARAGTAGDRTLLQGLAERQPRRLVQALLSSAQLDGQTKLSECKGRLLDRVWKAIVHAPLEFSGTDGFMKAEVTAGGVSLTSLNRRTLESRAVPGLRWCGEVVDVTGRLGGFNFQWAWSSGYVAGGGLRRGRPA